MAGARPEAQRRDHPPENGFAAPRLLLPHVDGCVLPGLGGFGRHQKQLVVLTWIPALFIGCSQFSDHFLLAQPNGTCVRPLANDSGNWTGPNLPEPALTLKANGTGEGFEEEEDGSAGMLCACAERRLELQTGLTQNVVTKWNLVCDSAWKVHIAKFSLLVGSIFGYLVMGVMADWFGRHPVLILSVLFMLIFGLSVAFSANVTVFSTLRFFEGFCLAGLALSLYVLTLPQQNFSMHVAVPVSNPNAMYQAGGNLSSQALAAATGSLSESGMLSPPQASLHRNVGSGGGSQRPTSAGSAGGMLDTTDLSVPSGAGSSPAGNGFVNPRGSPGLLSTASGNGLGKVMPTKSPPPPGGNMGMGSRKPDLRVVIPPSSKGMMPPLSEEEEMDLNTQRINSSQSNQPLATPVVSVTTPSLPPQGLVYSGMPTSYNPADYSLSSAEISSLQGFSSPGLSLGSMSAWQQHQLGQAALNSLVGVGHLPQGSNLSISTSQNINIKSEPISPPRERVTPSGFPPQQPQQGSSRQEVLGRSPADSLSSSCSSYDGSDREDHRPDFHSPLGLGRPPAGAEDRESPSVKRLRMDTWVT